MKRKVSFQTLGCRLNAFETDAISGQFLASGKYELCSKEEKADVVVINSCTVTDQADSRNRSAVRRAIRKNPNARVIVTGCYAQTDPDRLLEIEGVSAVIGNDHKSSLFEIVQSLSNESEKHSSGVLGFLPEKRKRRVYAEPFRYGDVVPIGHSRAYLKIQEGCDRKCSYCKIPDARGGGSSRSVIEVLDQVNRLQDAGIPEIVLTGVNLGWYKNEGIRFTDLLERILNRLNYSRLRLSSIEPCDVDRTLGELSNHPRFCNFFHVPLQSGSDRILRFMRRTYSSKSFALRMTAMREANPLVFTGTDVMVGFPGETEEDFMKTLELLEQSGIVHVHAFPFSPRTNTVAAEKLNTGEWKLIDKSVVKERMQRLEEYRIQKTQMYLNGLNGTVREAVVEKIPTKDSEYYEALTDDYARVRFQSSQPIARGALIWLRIENAIQILEAKSGRTRLYCEGRIEKF